METLTIDLKKKSSFEIGQQGDHNALCIHFINMKNVGTNKKYIYYTIDGIENCVPLTNDRFIIGYPLTAHSGIASAQLISKLNDNSIIKLSNVFAMNIKESKGYKDTGEYPVDPNIQSSYDLLDDLINETKDLINNYNYATLMEKLTQASSEATTSAATAKKCADELKDSTDFINTLDEKVAAQDSKIEKIEASTSHITTKQNTKIAALQTRMSEFTSLKDGSTTGDAELIDARIGADGTKYPSVGDAIRGQVEQLNDVSVNYGSTTLIKESNLAILDYFESGNWYAGGGLNEKYFRTKSTVVFEPNTYYFVNNNDYSLIITDTSDKTEIIHIVKAHSCDVIHMDKQFRIYSGDNQTIFNEQAISSALTNIEIYIVRIGDTVLDKIGTDTFSKFYSDYGDNLIIASEFEQGNWYGASDTSNTHYFRTKENYRFKQGDYFVINKNMFPLIFINFLNDIDSIITVPAHTSTVIKLTNPYRMFSGDVNQTFTSDKITSSVNKIELYYKEYTPKKYTVGENGTFTKLIDALAYANAYDHTTLYLLPGTYDLMQEFNNTPYGHGLNIGNGTKLICSPQSKIIYHYTGDDRQLLDYFSPLNAGYGDFTIENATIECSRCRYCFHDELGGHDGLYTHNFINCTMKIDNSDNPYEIGRCIGGGLGNGTIINVVGGKYECISNTGEIVPCISYHNPETSTCKNQITIKDIYSKRGSIKFGWHGSSNLITDCFVSNCVIDKGIIVEAEIPSMGFAKNMELYEWNNVVRP